MASLPRKFPASAARPLVGSHSLPKLSCLILKKKVKKVLNLPEIVKVLKITKKMPNTLVGLPNGIIKAIIFLCYLLFIIMCHDSENDSL